MAYRKKEDWLAEAERLGIDAENLSWPELQKTVSRALKREQLGMLDKTSSVVEQIAEELKEENQDRKAAAKQIRRADFEKMAADKLHNERITIAPEIGASTTRAIMYKEMLGEDVIVEEKHFDIRGLDITAANNMATGTYTIKGRSNERVVATSSIPKENAGIYWEPGEMFPTCELNGRKGYLWHHQSLSNVKDVLKQSGYYEKYKDQFKDEPNIWYASGHLVCDKGVVEYVLSEIQEEEKRKREKRGY